MPSVSATPAGSSPLVTPTTASLPALDADELQSQLVDTPVSVVLPDVRELDETIDTAFQLAMNRGPLCAEPVIGMAYFLESIELNSGDMSPSQGPFKLSPSSNTC
jgi:ribosome assembly protein 1